MRFRVRAVYKSGYENAYNGSNNEIQAGESPEGTITFDTPIEESEIWGIRVRLRTYETGSSSDYDWVFYNFKDPAPYLYSTFDVKASLVNGKSDYNDAKFDGIFLEVGCDETMIEAKHITESGYITIPGGGYTIKEEDINTGNELSSVPENSDMNFGLRLNSEIDIDTGGSDYVGYELIESGGKKIIFSGGAETRLPGKTVTWTFPAELNMNGSAVIPKFKSLSEQLTTSVPFAEVVSSDGIITAVKYKLVSPANTSEAITPSYTTDFRVRVYNTSGDVQMSEWRNASASGTWTLPKAIKVSALKHVSILLCSYEDASDPRYYDWYFYPASSETTPTTSFRRSSGGGCESLVGVAGMLILGAFILAKKSIIR